MATTLSITPRAGYPAQEVEAQESQHAEGWLLYGYRDPYADRWAFRCRKGVDGVTADFMVYVSDPRVPTWGDPVPARLEPMRSHNPPVEVHRLLAELTLMACDKADELNQGLAAQAEERRQRQEQERKEREEREAAARAERERRAQEERERRAALEAPIRAWRTDVRESLQWHVGGWVRLLRWGMRATAFGTLEHVELRETRFGRHEGYIELTTEKGKYMRLTFEELEVVQLRDEDERDYTPLKLPDHPEHDSPVRRDRREIAGGTGASRKDRLVTGE